MAHAHIHALSVCVIRLILFAFFLLAFTSFFLHFSPFFVIVVGFFLEFAIQSVVNVVFSICRVFDDNTGLNDK